MMATPFSSEPTLHGRSLGSLQSKYAEIEAAVAGKRASTIPLPHSRLLLLLSTLNCRPWSERCNGLIGKPFAFAYKI